MPDLPSPVVRLRWPTIVLAAALVGCSGAGGATTTTSAAVVTSAPAPTTTVSESVATELGGVVSIAIQLDLAPDEIQCVANGVPPSLLDVVVSKGFFAMTVEGQGLLFQAVARCASVQTQAQFGTMLVQSRQLSAKTAACVTKAFFDVLRTNVEAAQQATIPLVRATPAVRDAVTKAIGPCLSDDELDAFVEGSATAVTAPPSGG